MDCAFIEPDNRDLVSQFWPQWTEHQDQLYRCCLKLMNSNPTDAEDALSQAMLKAWEKVQKYDGQIGHFQAWLLKLTRNLCIDIIRERSRGAVGVESLEWVDDTEEMDIPSRVASPERFLETMELSIEIEQARSPSYRKRCGRRLFCIFTGSFPTQKLPNGKGYPTIMCTGGYTGPGNCLKRS